MKTLGDVRREVIALGFEETNEYTDLFTAAYNEAQTLISRTVVPIRKITTIVNNPPTNVANAEEYYNDFAEIEFNADAKAYCFEVSGIGRCVISDDNGIRTEDIHSVGKFATYKGFCSGVTSIAFVSSYRLAVRNFAMYDEVMSDNADDIAMYGSWVRYDIAKATDGRFIGIDDNYGVTSNGKRVVDYRIVGNDLYLPSNADGAYDVHYVAAPTPITADTPNDTPLEVAVDAQPLVPLWVAYRCWMDDDERKATMYRNDFASMAADIVTKPMDTSAPVYRNTTGWW
jgi:hypothetical protein